MNIVENNKLLVEFLEWSTPTDSKEEWFGQYYRPNHGWLKENELNFDTDWNLLMEVVEKIENSGVSEIMGRKLYSRFEINGNHIQLDWIKNNKYLVRLEIAQEHMFTHKGYARKEYIRVDINENASTLEAIYLTCVEFVKWFNKNNEL
jgi:hypothetical protein